MKMRKSKIINIVVPMAGEGQKFIQAGYTFPKPLIDINGKPMIQLVIENLRPSFAHRFILICKKEQYNKYSLHQVFQNATSGIYECIKLEAPTKGAACTVLTAVDFINNNSELIIANADQVLDARIDDFVKFARRNKLDGAIMTFRSSHPRWSYARADKSGDVTEVAEKRVISENATVGIYYFAKGSNFVEGATAMIAKDIRFNNEFYVCPVYNELILKGAKIKIWPIKEDQMHSLGTPEDLHGYLDYLARRGKRRK